MTIISPKLNKKNASPKRNLGSDCGSLIITESIWMSNTLKMVGIGFEKN